MANRRVKYAAVLQERAALHNSGIRRWRGTLNECSALRDGAILPANIGEEYLRRGTTNCRLVWSCLQSRCTHMHNSLPGSAPALFLVNPVSVITVPARNPFNPFGQTVGISGDYSADRIDKLDTDYLPISVGAKGHSVWYLELGVGWLDFLGPIAFYLPRTRFRTGPPSPCPQFNEPRHGPKSLRCRYAGIAQLLQSLVLAMSIDFYSRAFRQNGLVRGAVFQLPAGPVEIAFGSGVRAGYAK